MLGVSEEPFAGAGAFRIPLAVREEQSTDHRRAVCAGVLLGAPFARGPAVPSGSRGR